MSRHSISNFFSSLASTSIARISLFRLEVGDSLNNQPFNFAAQQNMLTCLGCCDWHETLTLGGNALLTDRTGTDVRAKWSM